MEAARVARVAVIFMLAGGPTACGDGDVPGIADEPGPPPAGYTRFEARPTPMIHPGDDAMFVQWLASPADVDRDVLDVRGWQSIGGHHIILFATEEEHAPGTTRPWAEADMAGDLRYVGGVGEGADAQKLPDSTVFRIPAGWSVIANLHWLNTTTESFEGRATIDLDIRAPSAERKPVGIFLNMTTEFSVPPKGEASAEATCVVKKDLDVIRIANHMHASGAAADTQIVHADGSTEDLIRDDAWTPEEYLNPKLHTWTPEAPYVIRAGDVLHTTCKWRNLSMQPLEFPNEMCTAVAYFVSDDGPVVPCLDGSWL